MKTPTIMHNAKWTLGMEVGCVYDYIRYEGDREHHANCRVLSIDSDETCTVEVLEFRVIPRSIH